VGPPECGGEADRELKSIRGEIGDAGIERVLFNHALDAALSRQSALAQTDRTALSELIGLHNIELLVLRLFNVDWFDPKTVELVLLVFNVFRPLIWLIMDAMLVSLVCAQWFLFFEKFSDQTNFHSCARALPDENPATVLRFHSEETVSQSSDRFHRTRTGSLPSDNRHYIVE
jgi:hypothetical protein